MQDECEQMGAYLTEVETVDENTWLTTTFLHPIVNTGTVFSKSIICKKDNSCDIIKKSYSFIFFSQRPLQVQYLLKYY